MMHSSTLNQRVQWVSKVIAQEGTYGIVRQVSRMAQVSRQTLYTWKAKGQHGLEAGLAEQPGLRVKTRKLSRAVLTLLVHGHASYRGIQRCLQELLGEEVSLGTITAIVQQAGQQAQRSLAEQKPAHGRVLALDEQYSSKRGEAYLNVVDAHSGYVWASLPPVAVDGESWTLALWYLREQGVECKGSVSDGGNAIHEALRTTQLLTTHQRDVWHVLHLLSQVQARLARVVQSEDHRTQVIERQEAYQSKTGRRSSGRPVKTTSQQHDQEVQHLHWVQQAVSYVFGQLHALVEVVVLSTGSTPHVLSEQQRRDEILTAVDLLHDSLSLVPVAVRNDVQKVCKQVIAVLPALLLFARQLEAVQRAAIEALGEAAVGLIGWAWQRRKELDMSSEQILTALPLAWRPIATHLLTAWTQVVRASSAVENWHSILRPHLAVHRSLSAGMLALLAVCHNHRVASRGLHTGSSPLQRSGLPQPSGDWLDVLGYAAPVG